MKKDCFSRSRNGERKEYKWRRFNERKGKMSPFGSHKKQNWSKKHNDDSNENRTFSASTSTPRRAVNERILLWGKIMLLSFAKKKTVRQFDSSIIVWHTVSFAIRNASVFLWFCGQLSALGIFKQVSVLYLWHSRIVKLHCNFVWMATYLCIGNVTLSAFILDSLRSDFFPSSFLPHNKSHEGRWVKFKQHK